PCASSALGSATAAAPSRAVWLRNREKIDPDALSLMPHTISLLLSPTIPRRILQHDLLDLSALAPYVVANLPRQLRGHELAILLIQSLEYPTSACIPIFRLEPFDRRLTCRVLHWWQLATVQLL